METQNGQSGETLRPLARIPDKPLTPVRLETQHLDVYRLGETLAQCGYFQDARQAGQAVVKVLAGAELGFGPIASMTGIHVIKGRVSLSAGLIGAAIKRSGKYDYRVREQSDEVCEIDFFEGAEKIGTSTFTAKDAKRAGTQNMGKFPRNMLFARALTNGARWYCPDVFSGPVYTPDELGASVDEETGEVVSVDVTPASETDPGAAVPTVDYGKLRTQSKNWLKSRPPEDFEDCVLQVREKIQSWPETERHFCELDIEGVEEWVRTRRDMIRKFRGEIFRAVVAGNQEEAIGAWRARIEELPEAWQEYAANEMMAATEEAEEEIIERTEAD